MATTSTASEHVTLTPGLVVSLDALRLLRALEARGLTIRTDGEGLLIGPRERVTEAERAAIREYRDELRALVECCEVLG